MSQEIIKIKSISQLHDMSGFEKPKHPLISVVDVSNFEIKPELINVKLSPNLYFIGLKSADCGLKYGRHHYDFSEGGTCFSKPQPSGIYYFRNRV